MTEQERKAFGWWLAGFVAAEGYFVLSLGRKGRKVERRACFGITLRDDDYPILLEIQKYFGCGNVTTQRKQGTTNPKAKFCVRDSDDLISKVFPIFDEFGLLAKKQGDFEIWKPAVELLHSVKQRPPNWKRGSWRSGSLPKWTDVESDLFADFHKNLRANRKYKEPEKKETRLSLGSLEWFGHWVAGFFDGEVCFDLQDARNGRFWIPHIQLRLKVRYDDLPIVMTLQKFFGCGSISRIEAKGKHNARVHWLVGGVENLSKIVEVLVKCPLRAKKRKDLALWKRGLELSTITKQRPRIFRKGRFSGFIPKWQENEKEEFRGLCKSIKANRKYAPSAWSRVK